MFIFNQPHEKHKPRLELETIMEEVINSIRRACVLAQNLEQDLPNLANQPAMLSLSIDQITEAFSGAKEKMLQFSRQNQTSDESPPTLVHETTQLQPQMDATLMQEWLRSSHALTMDQLFQMHQFHAARSTLQIGEMGGRDGEDNFERNKGPEEMQGINESSSRPRRRYIIHRFNYSFNTYNYENIC